MAYYDSLKSLGENTLQTRDIVKFLDEEYEVYPSYLNNLSSLYNNTIFNKLDITERNAFCKTYYGYSPNGGSFPEFRKYDFSAATRLVKALFERIEDVKSLKAAKASEEIEEVTINKPLKEEPELSVLLPSKRRNIKQVVIQKEITLNNL